MIPKELFDSLYNSGGLERTVSPTGIGLSKAGSLTEDNVICVGDTIALGSEYVGSSYSWNLGDCKAIGAGIREMRIHVGPGYRVYFVQRKEAILILLCGGSKSSQSRDIAKAKKIAQELEDDSYG